MLQVNGFFGHIKRNDLMSGLMFVGFLVAVQIMMAVVLSVPLVFIDSQHSILMPFNYLSRYGPWILIASVAVFAVLFVGHVNKVREQLGFRFVDTRDEPRLHNIIETLAITAGIAKPRVGIIESPARNAFACGLDQKNAVIVVTRGLLNALTPDELEAVIAHEITHIVNGDIRLIAAANVMLYSLEWLAKKNPIKQPPWWAWLLLPFWSFLFIAKLLSNASKLALDLGKVSRLLIASSREYIADAEAVRLTHKPEALISALRKIENLSALDGLQPENDAMMIDGATHGDYATHPTIFERITALAQHAGLKVDAQKPIIQPKTQTSNSGQSLWDRFNHYLDTQDAQEQAKIDASPIGKVKSLFARVQTVKPVSTWDRIRGYAGFSLTALVFLVPVIVSWDRLLSPRYVTDIADRQADGTYIHNGVQLSADEHKKIARDVGRFNTAPEFFAPSVLKSQVKVDAVDQSTLGLRRHSYDDEEGKL